MSLPARRRRRAGGAWSATTARESRGRRLAHAARRRRKAVAGDDHRPRRDRGERRCALSELLLECRTPTGQLRRSRQTRPQSASWGAARRPCAGSVRRHAGAAQWPPHRALRRAGRDDESFVDLNSLPLAAVERIEILRDGASAIYGADALAGVINIVLRRDFSGAEAAVRMGRSTHGDLDEKFATLTLGAGDLQRDRYNVFATVDLLRQEALPMTRVDFSRTADQRPRGGSDWRSIAGFPPTVLPLYRARSAAGRVARRSRSRPARRRQRLSAATTSIQRSCCPRSSAAACSWSARSISAPPRPSSPNCPSIARRRPRSSRRSACSPTSWRRHRPDQPLRRGPAVLVAAGREPAAPLREPHDFAARRCRRARPRSGWDWEAAGGYNRIDTDFRREQRPAAPIRFSPRSTPASSIRSATATILPCSPR